MARVPFGDCPSQTKKQDVMRPTDSSRNTIFTATAWLVGCSGIAVLLLLVTAAAPPAADPHHSGASRFTDRDKSGTGQLSNADQ